MNKRKGFTIVELLVAMALTLFVMTILSQAFVTSLETFSALKGVGEMDAGLRTAVINLQADLQQDHFANGRKLSDANFWTEKPKEGFFHIRQGSSLISVPPNPPYPAYRYENTDSDGLTSTSATDHKLHFSVRLRGRKRENYLTATVPVGSPLVSPAIATNWTGEPRDAIFQEGLTVNSQWAEVTYFLKKTGTTTEPTNPGSTLGTDLFSLYRSQFLALANNDDVNALKMAPTAGYEGFSISVKSGPPLYLYFNNPGDLAVGNRRFNPALSPPDMTSATLLLEKVVSFNVKVLRRPSGTAPPDFEDIGTTPFDTAASPSPSYNILALQIVLRVWDQRSQQTRQFTLIQDM